MSRYGYTSFTRSNSFETEENKNRPSWANEYEKVLDKSGVKSKQEDQSLFNQINEILNGKSKYSTVDECVEDLRNRTGLAQFLAKKQASESQPAIFQEIPELKTFIDNYTEHNPGSAVQAVIEAALRVPEIASGLSFSDDVDEDVKQYISSKLGDEETDKSNNENASLGKSDVSVDNSLVVENAPLNILNPKSF